MPKNTIKSHLNQNYEQIHQKCLSRKELFVDTTFPADDSSLYRAGNKSNDIVWKRPHEFIENPMFSSLNEIDWSNIIQGDLGNCWFISAIISAGRFPKLAEQIIPPNQSFTDNNYTGLFRFRFWYYGEWLEVVIDDQLPVDSRSNQLVFCHNRVNKNELVGPLVEKAYAKLNKCYELLSGGNLIDALIDLTGGVHETFKLADFRDSNESYIQLWEILFACFSMRSLGGAVIKSKSQCENFLSRGHSYCILEPFEIQKVGKTFNKLRNGAKIDENQVDESIKLLKMRDPWGEESWTGKWSRFSFEWTNLSRKLQTKLNGNTKSNGQFYISFEDFLINFDEFYLVHTNMNAFNYITSKKYSIWSCVSFLGSWSKSDCSAGGCGNDDLENFWRNPKYLVQVRKRQKVIISLIQSDQIRKRLESRNGSYEDSVEPIGFSLFSSLTSNNNFGRLGPNASHRIDTSGVYMYKREINKTMTLEPGEYVLVVSVFDKDVELKYVLRVFYENDDDISNSEKLSIVKIQENDLNVNSNTALGAKNNDDNILLFKSPQSNICSIL